MIEQKLFAKRKTKARYSIDDIETKINLPKIKKMSNYWEKIA